MSNWNKTYHWKTKDVGRFSKDYFTTRLVGSSYNLTSPTAGKVEVESLVDFDGDVELGNRKGKLITIYDCQIRLNWVGKLESGTEAKGTIFFPEVSHEIEDEGEEYRVSAQAALIHLFIPFLCVCVLVRHYHDDVKQRRDSSYV